jgi:DNA polymerase
MSRRRTELLSEMGLAPVWRLRRRGAPDAVEAQDSAPSAESREQQILQLDWTELKNRVAACTDCKLRASCTQTVFGVGDERAEWMLVGEAPGAEEDRLGEPFVGQAGRLLDNMLRTCCDRSG